MPVEYMDLSAESQQAQAQHTEALKKLEAKHKARSIVVPTDHNEIKSRLRELGHPITLFGEGPADRRERLRDVIASLQLSDEELARVQDIMNRKSVRGAEQAVSGQQKEVVYSVATDAMIEARKYLAEYSFNRAKNRIEQTHHIRSSEQEQLAEDQAAGALYAHCREMTLNASQFADVRPINSVRYSPSGTSIASSSFGATVKIWNSSSLSLEQELKGHEERVTALAWHPQRPLLASSSADCSCILWNTSTPGSSPAHTIKGHVGGLISCEFHPCGRLLGTAGVDTTWRLWDVETGQELLLQDGHFKECSSLAFHPDGGLILTTDWAGVALLWDLRSGQMIQAFQGHIKKITCSSFHPNGYQVATGSGDNMVRVWDIRKRKCGYCLPAHTSIISDLRYSQSGEVLVSSSFDGSVKIWGARDFHLLRALAGHGGRVMSADISSDEKHIVSAGFDRTIKLWAHKSEF